MMLKRSSIIVTMLVFTVVFVAACGDDKGTSDPGKTGSPSKKEGSQQGSGQLKATNRGAGSEGFSDEEIHIGSYGPQSGTARPWGAMTRAADVYFKWINEKGGIHGRKIIFHMFDDAYDPRKTIEGVRQLQEEVGIFAWTGGVGTATGLAVKDYLMKRGVPWVGPASGSSAWVNPPQKYLFALYPTYLLESRVLVRYALKELGKKKLAVVYQNDAFGREGLQGTRAELAKWQLEPVSEIPVSVSNMDMAPVVKKMRDIKAEVVLLWTTPVHAVRIVGISAAMKYKPQFMVSSVCGDTAIAYKNTKARWKGVISANFIERMDSQSKLMVQYKKAFDKFAVKDAEEWNSGFYSGFGLAEPLVEGLRRAGRDLTRERFVKAMESIKDFQGIMGKVTFGAFNPNNPLTRQGINHVFLTKCTGAYSYEKLTDWIDQNGLSQN